MILSLADDLTGALEAGGQFARFGIDARVTTDRDIARCPDVAALVIDTETRHLPEDEAAAVVRGVLSDALRFKPWLVYKKTDSTLRGNIAAEFRAMLQVMPGHPLVYVAAYPEMGRTVRGGLLFVNGTEVHRSAFASDPLDPVRTSNIADILSGIAATILDGEVSEDVAVAAREILAARPVPIAAGPAGLAGAIAEQLGAAVSGPLPRLPRCLIVNGSMHPASGAQIAFARTKSCVDDNWVEVEYQVDGSGEQVRSLLRTAAFDGLIVFGGDTAFAIHRALGGGHFEACGEVVRGVPVSRCGGLYWVTKAGGFGAPDLLCELRRLLK